MRKDIQIPVVKDVYIAIVHEKHLEYQTMDWNAYIINNSDDDIETVLIMTKGYNQDKITPVMRHSIALLPARNYAKIEYLQPEVLSLTNEFKVTFFKGNQMFDKSYKFPKNSINERALRTIPLMQIKGVLQQ